jgi:hypothetical protein
MPNYVPNSVSVGVVVMSVPIVVALVIVITIIERIRIIPMVVVLVIVIIIIILPPRWGMPIHHSMMYMPFMIIGSTLPRGEIFPYRPLKNYNYMIPWNKVNHDMKNDIIRIRLKNDVSN